MLYLWAHRAFDHMRGPEVFLQEALMLKEDPTLLTLEHVGDCSVCSQSLFRCQSCLALFAFEHMLSFSVNFKRLSTHAFEVAVLALLLVRIHVATHLVP